MSAALKTPAWPNVTSQATFRGCNPWALSGVDVYR